jgi:hypothetical protein
MYGVFFATVLISVLTCARRGFRCLARGKGIIPGDINYEQDLDVSVSDCSSESDKRLIYVLCTCPHSAFSAFVRLRDIHGFCMRLCQPRRLLAWSSTCFIYLVDNKLRVKLSLVCLSTLLWRASTSHKQELLSYDEYSDEYGDDAGHWVSGREMFLCCCSCFSCTVKRNMAI